MDAKDLSPTRRVVELSGEVSCIKPKLSRLIMWRRRKDWAYDHEASSNRRELVVRRVRNPRATNGTRALQSQGGGPMEFPQGPDRDSWMVIVNFGGHPVGLAYAYRLTTEGEAQIDDVVVDASCRRQRLGETVVADLMDWLSDEGLQRANLCPSEPWQRNWYQRFGFIAEGNRGSMSAALR